MKKAGEWRFPDGPAHDPVGMRTSHCPMEIAAIILEAGIRGKVVLLDDVFAFLGRRRLAVVSTAHVSGGIQSALVGFAITSDRRFIFDTLSTSRKALNLRANPATALVIGWDAEITVQIEGVAHEPKGASLESAKAAYFSVWPDGRDRAALPDIAYFIVDPKWMRYSSFVPTPEVADFILPTRG